MKLRIQNEVPRRKSFSIKLKNPKSRKTQRGAKTPLKTKSLNFPKRNPKKAP